MYGSDPPAVSPRASDHTFFDYYNDNVKNNRDNFFSKNALSFLFGEELKIPDSYIEFLKKSHKLGIIRDDPFDGKRLLKWIEMKNGEYYINAELPSI